MRRSRAYAPYMPIASAVPVRSVLSAALCFFVAVSTASAAADALRHDPFARRAARTPAATASAPAARTGESAPPTEAPPPWQPQLRGIMLAGRASVANVDGTVIGLGESIDGWRLIGLEDGHATFVRGRQKTVLSMHTAGQPRP